MARIGCFAVGHIHWADMAANDGNAPMAKDSAFHRWWSGCSHQQLWGISNLKT
jgi:hypothetical protein